MADQVDQAVDAAQDATDTNHLIDAEDDEGVADL